MENIQSLIDSRSFFGGCVSFWTPTDPAYSREEAVNAAKAHVLSLGRKVQFVAVYSPSGWLGLPYKVCGRLDVYTSSL